MLYTADRLGVPKYSITSAFLPAGEYAAFRFARSDPKVWGGRGQHGRPEQLSVHTGRSQIAPVRHGRAIVLDRGDSCFPRSPAGERVPSLQHCYEGIDWLFRTAGGILDAIRSSSNRVTSGIENERGITSR